MADKKRDIRYLSKDFNGFKNSLIEFTKTYFPDTYNDFTDTSTGMLFMEQAAYVGDVLSFYLDNQIQETFLQTSRQTENIFKSAYLLGYKPKITTAASVDIDIYQQLPAKLVDGVTVPDYDYCLTIPENTLVGSNNGSSVNFLIEDTVDFSVSSSIDSTEVTVYQVQDDQPLYYLLKKTRKAISATINSTQLTFNSPKRFDTRNVSGDNIIGILDVTDIDGNEWYEVPNIAQEVIYDSINNTITNDPNFSTDIEVPKLLKLKQVQRRFSTRFLNRNTLQFQFGAGSVGDNDEEIIPNPDNVGLGLPSQKTKLTTAFSPVNFMFTNTYGIAPGNTTLTVRYLTGGGIQSNVEANTLTNISTSNIRFNKPNLSNSSLANTIFNSVASNNERAADGGSNGDTLEEIKVNAISNFQNQLRAVTAQDYLIRTLSMPSNLGVIAKAFVTPTLSKETSINEIPSVLDIYILSYDINKNLRQASVALKRNLSTYLSEYRMINDSIQIKDAYIINVGVNFDITVLPDFNNNEVLNNCIDTLVRYFNVDRWQINQPILMKDLYILLDKVEGVQTVKNIKIINNTGESLGYSNYAYDVEAAMIDDVIYPSVDPMIFEVKFPLQDIKGRVVGF
jgi:hypothetical protein